MDGSQIHRRPLCDVHVDVIHTGDQVTESCRERCLQIHFRTQRSRVHETCDDGDSLDSLEAHPPIRMVEELLQNLPERIAAHGECYAMEQQRDADLGNVRELRVAQFPQAVEKLKILKNPIKV